MRVDSNRWNEKKRRGREIILVKIVENDMSIMEITESMTSDRIVVENACGRS